MKLKFILLLLTIALQSLFSQVVVTIPSNPTENDSITIIFDATQGDQGLMGYTGTVYAHTGVITNLSANTHDWKHVIGTWGDNQTQPALTRIGTNLYQLVVGFPRQFYSVTNPSEHILDMAFVFRSSDSQLTGRDSAGADIFAPIYSPGVNLVLNNPTLPSQFGDPMRAPIFVGQNDTVNMSISGVILGTELSSITLFVNGNQVAQTTQDTLNYSFLSADHQIGGNLIQAVSVDTGGVQDTLAFAIMKNPPVVQSPLPAGNEHGINYNSNSQVTLALYAPYKSFVYLIGDFNDWKVDTSYYMNKYEVTPDSVIWWITLNNVNPGLEYGFQYLVDGNIRIGDPYTEKVLDASNDQYIDSLTYPDLKPYPDGKTSNLVSVFQTDQPQYNWHNTNFQKPEKKDLIIYELLLRDFVSKHNYKTLTDTLHYLKNLGVNAIELMPVMEFEGNESWGYNPSFHHALDKYYGTKNDFKEFIDSAHGMGMAVILDIVLNHAYGQNPLVRLYFDDANGIPAANSPWFNQHSPNPVYSFGYDFNHDKPATKYYVDRVNNYWLSEYHVDGFRFDFTKGFTNTPGDGWNYDPSRIAILERMANKIWQTDSSAYVILEHFTANQEEIELSNYGMMLWGNLNCAYNQATMGYSAGPCGTWDFSGISYKNRNWTNPYLVGYMESHDEERLMFKNITYGNSSGNYNIQNLPTALQRVKMAAAFFITVPGPKMIWQFGELGYDISIDDPCRTCNKPILWNYFSKPNRYNLYRVFAELAKLKENYNVFNTNDFTMNVGGASKRINLYDSTMDVVIVGNFGVQSGSMDPNFSRTGTWYDFFSGDSITVTNPNGYIALAPGEFHIYSTVKLPTPPGNILADVGNKDVAAVKEYKLEQNYPNPFNPSTQIRYQILKPGMVSVKIYDILGREVKTLVNEEKQSGSFTVKWNGDNNFGQKVSSGIYFYRIVSGSFVDTKKMILMK